MITKYIMLMRSVCHNYELFIFLLAAIVDTGLLLVCEFEFNTDFCFIFRSRSSSDKSSWRQKTSASTGTQSVKCWGSFLQIRSRSVVRSQPVGYSVSEHCSELHAVFFLSLFHETQDKTRNLFVTPQDNSLFKPGLLNLFQCQAHFGSTKQSEEI